MAVQPGDPEALQLYELIGAPILALVQAESQAAQTSADFIKRIGFDPGAVQDKLLQEGGPMGGLRMAEFTMDRVGTDGVVRPHTVRVPVLSLFPIPLLQIKDAEVDFAVRVVSRVPLDSAGAAMNVPPEQYKPPLPATAKDYLAPSWVEFKGLLAPYPVEGQTNSEMNLRVKVRMEQADIPAGILKLLNVMDQNVTQTPIAPEEKRDGGQPQR
jgi:hypothetical protein